MTSDLGCTSCTPGVQQFGTIGLVVLQTTEILGLIFCLATQQLTCMYVCMDGCMYMYVHMHVPVLKSSRACSLSHCSLIWQNNESTYIHTYIRTVRVKITCPNLREEYSSCGPYKFTYNIAYAHARRSSGSCTALCAQRTKSS